MRGLTGKEAHAAALAGLPGMNPRRLARVLDGFRPAVAWRALGAGAHPGDPERRFAAATRQTDVDEMAACYERLGVQVLLPGGQGYPTALVGDPGAPAVLFALGDPGVLDGRPRVAIVGTRSATHYGRAVASELGAALAAEGVCVVSGLASGIDAAAHAGALRTTGQTSAAPRETAAPAAVVGTGLDVVYPTSNRQLWEQVATCGVVLSESPLGTQPRPGVFPARNRIIAALSDVVVIVESHRNGGALFTVDAAARRAIPVCAVPGSVHSRASEGTNALLVDGCIPARDAGDVMVALSLARAGRDLVRMRAQRRTAADPGARTGPAPGAGSRHPGPERGDDERVAGGVGEPPGGKQGHSTDEGDDRDRNSRRGQGMSSLTASQRLLLEAVDETPTAFETILIRTDLNIATAAEACDQLVEQGLLRVGAGWWSTA